jgi:hypothetical protein
MRTEPVAKSVMSERKESIPQSNYNSYSNDDDDENDEEDDEMILEDRQSKPKIVNKKRNGKIHIGVTKFLDIVKKYYDEAKDEQYIPVGYLFQNLTLQGEIKNHYISFVADLVINVLENDRWTVVPLLSKLDNVGIKSYNVKGGEASYVGIYENRSLALICNGSGTYEINIHLDVSYDASSSSSEDRHLTLSVPSTSINRLKLLNTDHNTQIKVENSLSHEQSNGTLECTFSPTAILRVHMTPMVQVMAPTETMTIEEEDTEKKEATVPVTITVEQGVVHSIGEVSLNLQKY